MRVKTTNALMKYLRDTHNISISDSKDKRNLINIGYYHGYKGYRYINNPQNRIVIKDFKEIVSIVNFDSKLKSLLYPQLMQIETISKNIVLQLLVEEYNTDEFNEIYEKGITDYKNSSPKDYREKMKQRLGVQNSIYSALSRSYNNNNKIVSHFYSKDKHVPIWGIFEIITLGTFADLIKSLEFKARRKIDIEMGLNIAYDTDARFPEKIIYLIKALRNSVAHNDVVFDVRFKDSNINSTLCKYIENEIGCTNVDFNTITDYIIIITLLLKKYRFSKTELNRFITEYENIIEEFRNSIPFNIYSQVVHTDTKVKLTQLRKYIKK
ncbi:MAG: Abi family protein [Bacilli bacterium]|nr:Abi family protein [Bacilli bacterium]